MGKRVIDLRSQATRDYDDMMDQLHKDLNQSRKMYRDFEKMGIPTNNDRMRALKVQSENFKLEFDMRKRGVPGEDIKGMKSTLLEGGGSLLMGVLDIAQRGNFAVAGGIEEGLKLVAPEGSQEGELLDSIINRGRVGEYVAAATAGQSVKAGQVTGMAHRMWEVVTDDRDRDTLGKIIRRGIEVKNSGAMDAVVGLRVMNELFSGLGTFHGKKKPFSVVAQERQLLEGPSASEVLELRFGKSSFENPFHHEIEIQTSEGPRRIAHDGLFTRLFGAHIGFHQNGNGILSLEKDGLLDFRTDDIDHLGADVFTDPTTYLTAGSSGLIKAGGRPLAKAGMRRLAAHEAAEVLSRRTALQVAEEATDEAAAKALRQAHSFMTPREVAERLVIEESRTNPALFTRGGEIRFMGQKLTALGAKPGDQTKAARVLADKRIEKAFARFRRKILSGSSGKEIGQLRPVLENVGATGRRLTQFLRAEETANPEWLAAWSRSEGGALVKMRVLDNELKATGIRPHSAEANAMIDAVSDPMVPRDFPGLTEGQERLLAANSEVDDLYRTLHQEAIIPVSRRKVEDLRAMFTVDHRYGWARKLDERLNQARELYPDADILPRTEVFVRNPDAHIDLYMEKMSAQFPFMDTKKLASDVARDAQLGVRREVEQATQPLYNELYDIWRLRTEPGLNKSQQRQAQSLWRKRIRQLNNAEKNRAELLLAKGDRGAFITPMNRSTLVETLNDMRRTDRTLPKLHFIDDPVEHVRRRGQVAYQKEAQSYLMQKAQKLAGDDLFAKQQIESNLVAVGSLRNHPNASIERIGRALDAYDEAVTPVIETGVRKEVIERVPLGQDRYPVINGHLEKMTTRELEKRLTKAERAMKKTSAGPNSPIKDQVKRARAEDDLSSTLNEIARREVKDMNTTDRALELANLDLTNPMHKAKALLVLRAAEETGTLRDLRLALRGMERDPRYVAVDIQEQFEGLAKLADEIKGRKVAIDPDPANQVQEWEKQVVYRIVNEPPGQPMTKALEQLKTKEDIQLFFRSWLFGEDRFAKRWAPGTLSHRFWESMNVFNDIEDFTEGSAKIVKQLGLEGDEAQAMRQWIDESITLRRYLKDNNLEMNDLLPPSSMRGEIAPDGTKFRAFGGIQFKNGRWRLTADNVGPRLYLPESLTRQLIRHGEEGIRNPEVGNVMKAFDTAQNLLKFNLTVLGFPAFQIRNFISNNVYAFTSAGLDLLRPNDLMRAGKLAWRASDPSLAITRRGHRNSMQMMVMQDVAFGMDNNAPASLKAIEDRLRRLYAKPPGVKSYADDLSKVATDPKKLRKEAQAIRKQLNEEWFRDDLGNVYTQADILREIPKQRVDVDPRLLSEMVGDTAMRELLFDPRKVNQWRKSMRDKLLRSNAFFEQWTRQHLFMTHLRTGVGYEEAGRLANKWLLDYARLSPFEKAFMKRLFPFYTFYRKTVPLMVESLYTRPGAVSLQAKLMHEDQDPVLAFGTAAGERVTINRGGKTFVVGGVDLPIRTLKFLDALRPVAGTPESRAARQEGWKEIMLLMHPAIHTMLSLSTDYEVFQGREVSQDKMDAVGALVEKQFGRDSDFFNKTFRKTEDRRGQMHYYADIGLLRLLTKGAGLARIMNRADQMLGTVHELNNGELAKAIRFLSSINPQGMTGGQVELSKQYELRQRLIEEGERRGIFRQGKHTFEVDEVR